jgi:hypothetical protein
LFAGTAKDMPLILGYPCSRSLVCTMFLYFMLTSLPQFMI